MIALLGATGYTGRLIAAELARRRLPHRLGGRSADRLAQFARAAHRETFVVDVGDDARLDAFLEGADALITTVGPFLRLGLPVVEAAVRNRVPYLDTTGEGAFMQRVYDDFADAPVAVVPACGVDVILGDLAAAIAIADLGAPATDVNVYYHGALRLSRGSVRTLLEVIAPRVVKAPARRVLFPEGVRHAVEVPLGEQVSVSRHAGGARVVTAAIVPAVVARTAGSVMPVVERFRPRILPLVERLPEGPSERVRPRGRVRVMAEASGRSGRTAVLTECRDPYGLTARLIVEATQRVRSSGAMAPAEALDPEPFFQAVSGDTFTWRRLPDAGQTASTRASMNER